MEDRKQDKGILGIFTLSSHLLHKLERYIYLFIMIMTLRVF